MLKLAHEGRFWIENPSELPSGSDAVGRKLYALPTVTEVEGVPEITGARFEVLPAVIVNARSEAFETPSVTVMMMFDQLPAALGIPESVPL